MIEFKLPSLGADMEEGTLLAWHVKPGDSVKRGQVVAVVDTSKAAVDVEIWQDGVLQALLVQPGDKVPVGTVLATLRDANELPVPVAARQPVSPSARKRAKELGLDLALVRGTGIHGAVTLADIEAVARPTLPPVLAPDRQKEMRRAIASAMSRSKREIPHYYLSESIAMGTALAWLQQRNEGLPITERILPAVLLLKAVAVALKRTPELNGFYRDGQFQPSTAVHAGVAISLRGGGLVAPALHDVGDKPLAQLMHELADLVKRARAGSLRSSEMSDPTLTVTNLGEQGAESVLGVIYPPQVALVGFGRIVARPWVVAGQVQVQSVVCATLAADHRASDGHRGALFLIELNELLQQPQALADAFATPVVTRE
jgi:pyruvate dehydrogenase E2 component (dihydrolipoamide acetyltransferase)